MSYALPELMRRESGAALPAFFFQPKSTFRLPNDPFEAEADKVADKVVQGNTVEPIGGVGAAPGALQREAVSGSAGTTTAQPPFFSAAHGLPSGQQSFFNAAFGRDLSGVRIHNDAAAHQSANELNARAYTAGNDIFFGEGQYRPETEAGRHLLAHELTHTVQQGLAPAGIQKEDKEKPEFAPTLDVDFKLLPPQLQFRLFNFLLQGNTSEVSLDYRTKTFMAGLSYSYGDALAFSMRYRDFTTKLGWTPGDNAFTLGGGTGEFKFGLSATPEKRKYGLNLSYGAPLLPTWSAMNTAFTGGNSALMSMGAGLPYMMDNPYAYYEAHKDDIQKLSDTKDMVDKITESGKKRIRFGAAFNLTYDPTSRLVITLGAGAIF